MFELWRHLEPAGTFVAVPVGDRSDVRGLPLSPRVVTPAFALEDKLPVAPGGLLSLRDPDVGDVGATLRGIGAGGEPSSGCGDAVVG